MTNFTKINATAAQRIYIDPKTISFGGTEKGGEGEKVGPAEESPPSPPLPPPVSEIAPVSTSRFMADGVFTHAPASNPVVAALREQGKYRHLLSHGRHAIECPSAHDHAEGVQGTTVYVEPTANAPYGQLSCPYDHAEPVTIQGLLDRLAIEPQQARCKARIRLKVGEQNLVLAAAEHALSSCEDFFTFNGAIVSIKSTPGNADVTVELANEQTLAIALSAAADWEKHDGRAKGFVPCDPPIRVCQMLVKANDHHSLRPLHGIARQPYFRERDRELVMQPGYDAKSGIYGRFSAEAFVFPQPTREAADHALARLCALIGEFHFATETDRSAALCAMLTAACRSSLPLAPAFNLTAASSGSGKSYLASIITPFAGPGAPLNMSYPAGSEEASKAMLAALIQVPAVIAFDDMQTDWLPYGVMNRMLTAPTISERVLGSSRVVTAGTRSFIIGTGNNVGPVRDMCRRVISIRLAPPSSTPALLDYAGRPVEAVRQNREAYVVDALTIIRAWREGGCRRANVPTIGSFGEWSDLCRQPLLWLGQPDPAASLMDQMRNDPDTAALGAFMEAWSHQFGQKPMMVRKLVEVAEAHPDQALAETLAELPVMERRLVNHSKLGWFLKKNAGRVIDGRMIQQVPAAERTSWAVVPIG